MNFTVDFNKWAFRDSLYQNRGNSMLLNNWGNMCCLGFCMSQLFTERNLLDLVSPGSIKLNSFCKIPDTFKDFALIDENGESRGVDSELSCKAMDINDNYDLPFRAKIVQLQELFIKHGHTIDFINLPV